MISLVNNRVAIMIHILYNVIMYRYVKFDDIEKDKWNGCVHYAHNGNVYGYYWYLKAAIKEWDAVVEDDYESVMPIFNRALSTEEYNLLPSLGPYSVNVLNKTRIESMLELCIENQIASWYPISTAIGNRYLSGYEKKTSMRSIVHVGKGYDSLASAYSEAAKSSLSEGAPEFMKLVSGIKPERGVDAMRFSPYTQNAMLRIMYNAMHRGIGFSTGAVDSRDERLLALSFYLVSHNSFYELFSFEKTPRPLQNILLDLMIRNHAAKPMKIIMYSDPELSKGFGFEEELYSSICIHKNWKNKLKKKLKLTY